MRNYLIRVEVSDGDHYIYVQKAYDMQNARRTAYYHVFGEKGSKESLDIHTFVLHTTTIVAKRD